MEPAHETLLGRLKSAKEANYLPLLEGCDDAHREIHRLLDQRLLALMERKCGRGLAAQE